MIRLDRERGGQGAHQSGERTIAAKAVGFLIAGILSTLGVAFFTLFLSSISNLGYQSSLLISQIIWLWLGARFFAFTMFRKRRMMFGEFRRYVGSHAVSFISVQALTPVFLEFFGLPLLVSIFLAAAVGAALKFVLLAFLTFRKTISEPVK